MDIWHNEEISEDWESAFLSVIQKGVRIEEFHCEPVAYKVLS